MTSLRNSVNIVISETSDVNTLVLSGNYIWKHSTYKTLMNRTLNYELLDGQTSLNKVLAFTRRTCFACNISTTESQDTINAIHIVRYLYMIKKVKCTTQLQSIQQIFALSRRTSFPGNNNRTWRHCRHHSYGQISLPVSKSEVHFPVAEVSTDFCSFQTYQFSR